MGKAKKSTKKFNTKHLKHTIDQRKKVKQYKKLVGTKKSTRSTTSDDADAKDKDAIFEDMDVEEFFEGGFEVPKESKALKKLKNEKESRKEPEDNESEEESSSEDEADLHGKELQDLAKDDPEFYKYLQNNDQDLLDFKAVDPLEAMSDSEDEEESKPEPQEPQEEEKVETTEVTMKMIKEWEKNLKSTTPTIRTLKSVVIAFKSAANMDSGETYRYSITDEKVFNYLMILVLKKLPAAIQTLTPYKTSQNGARSLPNSNNKKISQITTILKTHAGSLIILLNDITNTETAALILQSVQELLPYYISLRKLLKEIMTSVITLWGSTKEIDTQIAAFAFLNNASREYPKALLELVLKSTYSSFIKSCRKTNIHTMPMINFQKNSAVELFGLDTSLSYQVGFEYIRQLAIHLRSSVNNPTKDSYKSIYNWQYCHSLDFWSRMLAIHCNPEKELLSTKNKENPLRQLIYPLVQVTIGTIRLLPTAQFFPLRFYLIRSLIRLSQNAGVYIPIFPLLSEVLNSTSFNKFPKPSQLAAVDFDNVIKVNQAYLGSRAYQDGLFEQFIELTSEFFVLYCKSVSFPELITPPVIFLRRYIKKCNNGKFSKQLSNLVDKLNSNGKFIEQKRSTIEYGPSNKAEVARFLQDFDWEKTPLGAYVSTQRTVREAKLKVLRESMEAAEEEEQERKQKEENDDEEEMDIGSEDDE